MLPCPFSFFFFNLQALCLLVSCGLVGDAVVGLLSAGLSRHPAVSPLALVRVSTYFRSIALSSCSVPNF